MTSQDWLVGSMGAAVVLVVCVGLPVAWLRSRWLDWKTLREVRREHERRSA